MSENQTALPPLSEESIARIERAVFDEIVDAPPVPTPLSSTAVRARHRRRRWATGLGIAAAFVGGILIAPPLLNAVSPSGVDMASYDTAVREVAPAGSESVGMSATDASGDAAGGAAAGSVDARVSEDGRDIISTANMTVRVTDVSTSVDAIGALAREHDGYVEATDIGLSADAGMETVPGEPRPAGNGWVSIRIPAAELDTVMSAVGDEGTVLSSSISAQDVTATVIDLQARADATRASVKRLTDLMGKSGSVGDLIAAETALSERQAQLESYEQQLKSLDDQVTMASISIQLTEQTTATTADPAGFMDGLLAGWNGLIVSLNAIVVALGFILPWLVIAGAVVLVIWLIRRRRGRHDGGSSPAESA